MKLNFSSVCDLEHEAFQTYVKISESNECTSFEKGSAYGYWRALEELRHAMVIEFKGVHK